MKRERMNDTARRQMDAAQELEKLDQFAGMAMQALLISRPDDEHCDIAEAAYDAARYMLDQRELYAEVFSIKADELEKSNENAEE
jgi:hypothetical protein